MNQLSFKAFLALDEDVNNDLAQLTLQKQQLLLRKAAADKQIDNQINMIDKQLFQKEKQKQAEDKKLGQNNPTNPQQDPNQQQANKTTTPGSAGAQTPGMAAQSAIPQR